MKTFLIMSLLILNLGSSVFADDYVLSADKLSVPFTIQVDSFAVTLNTPFSNPNHLGANFNLTLTVETPKQEYPFEAINVTTEYNNQPVAVSEIKKFHQEPQTLVNKCFLLTGSITNTSQIQEMGSKISTDGELNFTVLVKLVTMTTGVTYSDEVVTEECEMNIVCKGIRAAIVSVNNYTWTGTTHQGPFPCEYTSSEC